MLDTPTDGRCSQVMPELVVCGNAECSDSYDFPCELILVAESTVRICSTSGSLSVFSPLVHVEVACTARSHVVWAPLAFLDSARLPADIRPFSAVLGIFVLDDVASPESPNKRDLSRRKLQWTRSYSA